MSCYSEHAEALCCWGDSSQREGEVNVYAYAVAGQPGIVNTTSTDYTTLNILAQHPGKVTVSQANVYTVNVNLNNPASSITTQQVNLVQGTNGYTMIVHLPARTMIGISFAA